MNKAEEKIAAVTKPEYEGTPIKCGPVTIILPPLVARQMRTHQEAITEIGKFTDGTSITEGLDKAVPVILAAAQRNYPDLTAADLEDLLDAVTFKVAVRSTLGSSGYRPAAPGE